MGFWPRQSSHAMTPWTSQWRCRSSPTCARSARRCNHDRDQHRQAPWRSDGAHRKTCFLLPRQGSISAGKSSRRSGGEGSGPEPDPVFAAIADHWPPAWPITRLPKRRARRSPVCQSTEQRRQPLAAAMDRDGDTLQALLYLRPTTFDGLAALLEHVGQPEWFIYDRREGTGETILSGLTSARL